MLDKTTEVKSVREPTSGPSPSRASRPSRNPCDIEFPQFCCGGGTILNFLVGTALFKTLTAPVIPLSHLIGLGLLAVVSSAGMAASPVVLSAGTAATLIVVAVWEWASLRRRS